MSQFEPLWAVLCASALIMFRVGMALHETGSLRAKNSISAMLRAAADIAVAVIAFWLIGGWICWSETTAVLGPFIAGSGTRSATLLLLGTATVLLATGIVGGVLAERSKLIPVLASSAVLAAFVCPLAVHWTQRSWLHRMGFHDLAGASFLHVAGATVALVGAIVIGPRSGKYNRDGSSNAIPGHSVPLAGAGMLIMLAAGLPYVATFAALSGGAPDVHPGLELEGIAAVALNVLLAAAGGALASLIVSHFRYGKPDFHLVFGGLIGGMIAITAGADIVPAWAALATGAIAGILIPRVMVAIDLSAHIDDPISAISVHGIGGACGIVAAGIFVRTAPSSGRFAFLGVQALGLLVIIALAAVFALALFVILKRLTRLRIREEDEFDGLDLAEHDIAAYPDFQQTMIKSYHLREA
jgi:Amt family ammonium transporter